MATIKGQNLRVMSGAKCVAKATSCTFHVGTETEASSTKDSTGDWAETEIVGLNWDASTDSLVTLDAEGSTGLNTAELLSLIINKTLLTLVFDQTSGTNNRVGQNAAIKRTGTAYLTDFSLTAPNRANSTLTCQFTGTGALS